MLASAAGHTEIVHLLCSSGPSVAGISRRDIRGRDAIMEASRGGHDTVLQILLTFAANTDERSPKELLENADSDGNTALHFASSNGHLLVLRTLLAAGADPEKRNAWSWTPVAYSATVQAEVYFKGLVAEVERRRGARREGELAREREAQLGKLGEKGRGKGGGMGGMLKGGLRLVGGEGDDL